MVQAAGGCHSKQNIRGQGFALGFILLVRSLRSKQDTGRAWQWKQKGEVEVDPSDPLTGRAAWGGDLGL